MAVSTTTFAERLSRIETGQTIQADSLPYIVQPKRQKKKRRLALPLFVTLAVVGGGAAYAWVGGNIDVNSVIALAY